MGVRPVLLAASERIPEAVARKRLHLEPHFCCEYLGRCSCMARMFMSDQRSIENMKWYQDQMQPYIQTWTRLVYTWKKSRSLEQLRDRCQDIGYW